MTTVPQISVPTRKQQIAFYVAYLLFMTLFVVLLGFVFAVLPYLFTGWFFSGEDAIHKIHDISISALLWVAFAGMIAQLRQPAEQVGGMQQAVVVFLMLAISVLLANFFFPPPFLFLALALFVALFHPARRALLRVREHFSVHLGALVGVAAVPLLPFAAGQFNLQHLLSGTADPHALQGHWMVMGGYAMTIVALGLVASTRPTGWRVPAWSTGFLAVLLGLASVLLPTQSSGLGTIWGVLAISWGVLFIAVAEATQRREG